MPSLKDKIVITGAAGFIGMHLCEEFIKEGFEVIGIDNLIPSYGGDWATIRKDYLRRIHGLEINVLDLSEISNLNVITELARESRAIIHLAAWPGVRYGQSNPFEYGRNNLNAFNNILEVVKITKPNKFLFASSSSIYGDLGSFGPVKEEQATGLNLKSYYAATKWANETLAMQHQKISAVPSMALRFFTVFGEYGRPDMAYWKFLNNTLTGQAIELFGNNGGSRNYTYVKDTTKIISRLLDSKVEGYEAVNVTCGNPMETIAMVEIMSDLVEKLPEVISSQRPDVDVEKTWADLSKVESLIGKMNATPPQDALSNFVNWYTNNVSK